MNNFSLENKTYLVTGASSGIGREIAITLSEFGATVIISGRNNIRLEETFSKLNSKYNNKILSGDISDNNIISYISNNTPNLDGIVHAAGIMKLMPFKFVTQELLRNMMDINFFAPIELTLSLFKTKKIKDHSSIVFITSINGAVIGSKANSIYSATKGALTSMIKSMALDLAKNKIRVNNIAPGMIQTEGIEDIKNIVSEQSIALDLLKYPLQSYGTPLDIANSCVYLLSDASKWVTGTTLVIDGGFTIQ